MNTRAFIFFPDIAGVRRSYGGARFDGQALRFVYLDGRILPARCRGSDSGAGRHIMLIGIAVAMFVALFAWGARYFGWDDPDGKVQLALVTSFILGIISGFKVKG
jgi:hypothetical protein